MGCNQNKPNPPISTYAEVLKRLWNRRHLTEKEILRRLVTRHIDTEKYGLGLTKFREARLTLGLKGTRQQGKSFYSFEYPHVDKILAHTVDTISDAMVVLRQHYPKAGRDEMVNLLFHEKKMRVAKSVVTAWFDQWEPDLVREWKHARLRHKHFWAAGGNDLWCIDQHDKWKKFGLGLHTGVDPFIGQIKWLKRLCDSLDIHALSFKVIPDPRTSVLPRGIPISDPHLIQTLKAPYNIDGSMKRRTFLQRRFTPGFEDILDVPSCIPDIHYDRSNPLQYNIFKWLFIPWLQAELDGWSEHYNRKRKRYQKDKILPQGGSPDDMEEYPEEYGFVNFKIPIDSTTPYLQEAENLWAPRDHEVFELVPKDFAVLIEHVYVHILNKPELTRENVWSVYMDILECLEQLPTVKELPLSGYNEDDEDYSLNTGDKEMIAHLGPELQNLQQLLVDQDEYYMGGVNSGLGAEGDIMGDESVLDVYCDFSSDEERNTGDDLYNAHLDNDSGSEVAHLIVQHSDIDIYCNNKPRNMYFIYVSN
ncbi:hypothetical protein E1B28_011366 [Marasmius oreades]|uniref:Uncharacterized protein n=1 Tax=Marasmius oreades TaxID=181124 RepID=A0A9P7RTX4_9AGAR|nr:uncharacterized protein E1B28_011366 [Marasmius oreades]KAG7089711.1 hypothetical protein E1B28_011366 [Marasmius oreades]